MKFSTRDLYGKMVCAGRCVVRARRRFIRALVPQRELCEAVYLYCPPEEAEEQRRRLFRNYCTGVGDVSWSEADQADSAVRFLVNALFSPDAAAWVRRIQELFPNCLHACTTHGAGVLHLLLAQSVRPRTPEERARTPQQQAAALRFLTEAGVDVNARDGRGRTPLHQAATAGRADFVRLLLCAGADPTARDKRGLTPQDCVHGNCRVGRMSGL